MNCDVILFICLYTVVAQIVQTTDLHEEKLELEVVHDVCRFQYLFLNKLVVDVSIEGGFVYAVQVEQLVRRWSPLIWMSPGEKYMPLSAEEFINNVYVADENGKKIDNNVNRKILKNKSKTFHFVPHTNLDILKNDTFSFVYGKNPNLYSVPIYALVQQCPYPNSKEDRSEDSYNFSIARNGFYMHVSYWIFFPYNEGKELCFIGKVPSPRIFNKCLGHFKTMGNHVGDWEHMSLSFAGKYHPEKLFLSVHDTGVYYGYDSQRKYFKFEYKVSRKGVNQVPRFPEILRTQGDHPVVFSANGSHGLWASAGEFDFIRVPKLTDKNGYGIPWKTWNNIRIYHLGKSNLPSWMIFGGKWGNPRRNCLLLRKLGLCEFTDGPVGILRKKQDFHC